MIHILEHVTLTAHWYHMITIPATWSVLLWEYVLFVQSKSSKFNLPEEHFRVELSQKLHSFEWNSILRDIFQFYDVFRENRQQHLPVGLLNLIHMILLVGSRFFELFPHQKVQKESLEKKKCYRKLKNIRNEFDTTVECSIGTQTNVRKDPLCPK